MKKLNQAIDRFCILHPQFGIPNLMLYIVVANVAVFLLDSFSNYGLTRLLYFSPDMLLRAQIWRLVTFVLIPEGGGALTVLISCYFYYWIGSTLERRWGTAKFTCYYLGGMIFTLLGTIVLWLVTGVSIPLAGASYVNFAMFLAFAALWPEAQVPLLFIIPIKLKYLAYSALAFSAWNIVSYIVARSPAPAIVPVMALLNFVIFFWPELQRLLGMEAAQTRQSVRYRATRAANVKRQARSANAGERKCAVCGRTNVSNPELDFRYCSRCAGYHCFCSDHIFSHVHFTDDAP